MTCENEYTMVPINLLNVAGGEIAIQDLINTNNTPNLTKARNSGEADQIMIWSGNGYDTYFLHNEKGKAEEKVNDGKWVDTYDASKPCVKTVKSGDAIFFKKAPGKSGSVVITIPGQVPSTVNNTLVKGYNMMSSGMPCDFYLNGTVGGVDMTTFWTEANGFTRARNSGEADQIMVWNGNGYNVYFLHNNKGKEEEKINDGKWVDTYDATKAITAPISASSAFFFLKQKDGVIPFNPPVPYSL